MDGDSMHWCHLPDDGAPAIARRKVAAAMQEARLARMERSMREGKLLERARRDYTAGLKEVLGVKRLDTLRGLRADLAAEQAEALHPSRGRLPSEEEAAAATQRRRRRTTAALGKQGIDPEKLRRLGRRVQAALEPRLAPRPKGSRRAQQDRIELVLPDDVPLEVRENQGNPWTIRTHPYPGQGSWYEWYPSGSFYKGTIDHTKRDIGEVGHLNRVSIYSGSDIDICNAYYRTSVGFWYQMPETGLLECWIEAQHGQGKHKCQLDDEWGWSDSTVRQWSYLSLRTWGPPTSELRTALMSNWYQDGHTDGHWSRQYLAPGGTYWAHLFSNVVYAKNAWIYVDVGVYSRNYVFTNDVEASSRVDFRWFFPRVYVDSSD